MDTSLITDIVTYAAAVVGAARLIAKGIAKITKVTPTTADDEIVSAAQAWIRRIQKVLDTIGLPVDGADKSAGKK